MSELTLFDIGPAEGKAGLRWERVTNGTLGKLGARWFLLDDNRDTGYSIQHCGHPTANYPYTGTGPDGQMIVAQNGRGFMRLDLAQADLVTLYVKGRR
jgi:hypothetical protein